MALFETNEREGLSEVPPEALSDDVPETVTDIAPEITEDNSIKVLTEIKSDDSTEVSSQDQSDGLAELLSGIQSEDSAEISLENQSDDMTMLLAELQSDDSAIVLREIQSDDSTVVLSEIQSEDSTEDLSEVESDDLTMVLSEIQSGDSAVVLSETQPEDSTADLPDVESDDLTMVLSEIQSDDSTDDSIEIITDLMFDPEREQGEGQIEEYFIEGTPAWAVPMSGEGVDGKIAVEREAQKALDKAKSKDKPGKAVKSEKTTEKPSEKPRKEKKQRGKKGETEPMYISIHDENAADLLKHGKIRKRNPFYGLLQMGRIPIGVYIGIICALTVIVVGSGALLLTQINSLAEERVQSQYAGKIFINNDLSASNAFNFIHVNVPLGFGDTNLTIRRMSFDDSATVFHFSREFDFSAYDVWIVDTYNRHIGLDAAFVDKDGKVMLPENIVRFGPLTAGSLGFTLGLREISTGYEREYEFLFTKVHGLTAERRFERLISIKDGAGNVVGAIQSASFASTGSQINFTFDKKGYGLRYDPELSGSSITLMEWGKEVLPSASGVRMYELDEGHYLCRADFGPVTHLGGSVNLIFSRIFTELPIGQTVNASPLFNNLQPENRVIFETDGYRVVLEFILQNTDGSYLLVLHSEDMDAEITDSSDRSNRREVLLDSQLVFTLTNGEKAVLNGTDGRSRDIGANLFFKPDDSPHGEAIRAGRFRDISLVVNSALIRVPDISVSIDIDALREERASFEQDLISHFRRQNREKDRYNAAVITYERLNAAHRAIVRELWYDEDGVSHIVTREVSGFVDPYSARLDVDNIIVLSEGIY